MSAISWVFDKSKESDVSVGVRSFKGNLNSRMISEIKRLNGKGRTFDAEFEGKLWTVCPELPKYKGDSSCFIAFHRCYSSEAECNKTYEDFNKKYGTNK